jgi:type IV pilus assembly protein PilM
MGKRNKVIINCGSSCVSFASVVYDANQSTIENYHVQALDYEPSDEAAWLQALTSAIQAVIATHKFSGRASVIIPGHYVLSKALKIAHVEASKRAQVIAFEAQQKLPYQLHELEWGSQEIFDDGIETEALFLACKKQLISAVLLAFKGSALKIESIRAASVLDQSTLTACSDLGAEPVLLINVGANSTNLTYAADDRFALRNVSIGGNFLTQSIADKVGHSFEQAEQLKLRFFDGSENFSSEDPGHKQLIECAQAFMRRLNQELTRSILNFRRQLGAAAPSKILLTGGGSLIEQLRIELSQRQKISVERLDPTEPISWGSNIQIDLATLGLSEIVGEVISTQQTQVSVNLLPEAEQKQLAFVGKKPWLMVASLLFAAAPWPAYMGFKAAGASAHADQTALQAQVAPLVDSQAQIEEYSAQASLYQDALQEVQHVVGSKYNWIQLIADLQDGLNSIEDVWLDHLKIARTAGEDQESENYELVLRGKMLVRESVDAQRVNQKILSHRINSLQSSFTQSKFIASAKSPVITWTSLRAGLNVLPFRLNLIVDKDSIL